MVSRMSGTKHGLTMRPAATFMTRVVHAGIVRETCLVHPDVCKSKMAKFRLHEQSRCLSDSCGSGPNMVLPLAVIPLQKRQVTQS